MADSGSMDNDLRDWKSRVIFGDQLGGHVLPDWLEGSYQYLLSQVGHPKYPCFFGTQAERQGEMFYAWVSGKDITSLPATMTKFAELASTQRFEKFNIAVFFEPDAAPLSHEAYEQCFWQTLQHLHHEDPHPGAEQQHDPAEPEWEFTYGGIETFVVCGCPSFEKRSSRNLGPGMVLLFQPRSVFVDKVTNRAISHQARTEVRKRLSQWDKVEAHPDLGYYGDPENREWKQYFLADDNAPRVGVCPFRARRPSGVKPTDVSAPETIVSIIRKHAAVKPDALAIRFLADGESDERTLSYQALCARVDALSAALHRHAAPGDRAVLLLPSGLDYAVSFLACLHAGLIAVPAYPPERRPSQHGARLHAILDDCDPRLLLTDRAHAEDVEVLSSQHANLSRHVLQVDGELLPHAPAQDNADAHRIQPDDIAFLQYTSGSTAAPKGVMVSHANLIANEIAIRSAMALGDGDTVVNWLPLYHDMGLIGGLLAPLFNGIPLVLLSPAHVLERPSRWLAAISRHGGTVSGGPDFAYQLCVDRIRDAQTAGLDLSRWRLAFTGAEPIRAQTLRAFSERFASTGLPATAMYACYGLAEATLLVTGVVAGQGTPSPRFNAAALMRGKASVDEASDTALVDCGLVQNDHRLLIVNPSSHAELDHGHVGEVWFSGASVARGYWNNPEANDDTFVTRADGSRWLCTGDLGFLTHEGRLFISGRAKDLIIVRGQNCHPQDIEASLAEAVATLRKGRIAAFPIVTQHGIEGIGIAAEMSRANARKLDHDEVFAAINREVAQQYQEPASLILLLEPGALPRTSSGKIRRSACIEGWHNGSLATVAVFDRASHQHEALQQAPYVAAGSPLEQKLVTIWETVFATAHPIGIHNDFFDLGGDSLKAARLATRISDLHGHGTRLPLAFVFDARTIAEQAQHLAKFTASEQASTAPITRADRRSPPPRSPLSFAQERLWFLRQLEPDSAAYHIAGGVRLEGTLDVVAIRAALDSIVHRHESLRARFGEHEGVAFQIVTEATDYGWIELDFGSFPAEQQEGETAAALTRAATMPFDLEHGPSLRVLLIRLGAQTHLLHFAMHHIVSDGWSMGVLTREFAAHYEATLACRSARLPVLPIQYTDYAAWQRRTLDDASIRPHLDWWRKRLGDEHPVLDLPLDRPRKATRSERGGRIVEALSASSFEQLRAVSRRHGVTPFMTLLAVWNALLYRYTGQRDIRIGLPVGGRDRVETECLIGFFVNTLVIRCELSGDQPFDALLQQVRAQVLDAQSHQDLPFAKLVEALQPERQQGLSPLFQVAFNYLHGDLLGTMKLPGLVAMPQAQAANAVQWDLTLDVQETTGSDGLQLVFDYAADIFDAGTVARIARHYCAMLDTLLVQPSIALGAVDLLRDDDNDSVQAATPVEHPFVSITRRFAVCAQATPSAHALTCAGRTLTYAELDTRSNAIAGRLIAAGVCRDDRVGLCVERSIELVVALLGILKAGAAFMPFETDIPDERLHELLANLNAAQVVVDPAQARHFGNLLPAGRAIVIGDTGPHEAISSMPLREPVIHPDQLAYVIHTSGSTGRPKAVGISHRALSAHLDDVIAAFALNSSDVVLQFSTLSFDAAIEQLLPALSVGAAVCLRGREHWSTSALNRAIANEGITVADLPTAYWQQWLADLPAQLHALRLLSVGGEALPVDTLPIWFDGPLAALRLVNVYGPTEATVSALIHEIAPSDAMQSSVAIGRALPSRRVRVLDADGNATPVGIAGELGLGGAAIARGYLGQAGLSAERFVPDPHGFGARLYRSGDHCRQRAGDAIVEYLGRLDQQIKLRGYRIEPGEIEAALRGIDGVREAVVALVGSGEQGQLAAWFTGSADETTVRDRLATSLPHYLLPSQLLRLDALPMTAGGKIDRRALPAIAAHAPAFVTPATDTERAIARLWAEVLGVASIGASDNFFDRGGHSLLAVKLVARLRQSLGRDVSLQTLFAQPLLSAFAAAVDRDAGSASPRLPITPRASGAAQMVPLSHAQERLWFLWKLEPASTAYIMAGGVRLEGLLDAAAIRAAVQALVRRHESLRTHFVEIDGVPQQVVDDDASHGWSELDLSSEPAAGIDTRLHQELSRAADAAFDLEHGPLLRATLIRCDAHTHVLHFALHHIVCDGWSVNLLLKQFAAFYESARAGRAAALPALAIQYGDYALWQRQVLDDAALAPQFDYWRTRLGDGQPVLDLPLDRRRPATRSAEGGRVSHPVSKGLSERLRALSRQQDTTLFMTLLAAWNLLLHRYSGQRDIRIGLPVSGRDELETQGLIGFFINTLVIRTDVTGDQPFAALLQQIKASVLDAQAHQDVPFDRLVAALGDTRDGSRNALVQVKFLLEEAEPPLVLSQLEVTPLAPTRISARFDLSLDVVTADDGSLDCQFTYARDVFDAATIERMAACYEIVLRHVVAEPTICIGALPLSEVSMAIAGEGRRETEDFIARIERHARQRGYAVALVDEGRSLDWRTLWQRSGQLAGRLRQLGVGAESVVAISLPRSVDFVASLLAIWRAGGTFLPLDPALPRDRRDWQMQHSGARWLIADDDAAEGRHGVIVVAPHEGSNQYAPTPKTSPHPEQAAYIIYTSGSSGRPKGVAVSHAALASYVAAVLERVPSDVQRAAYVSTPAADLGHTALFGALWSGWTLHLISAERAFDPDRFGEYLDAHEIDLLKIVPSHLGGLLQAAKPAQVLPRRCLVLGGESTTAALAARVASLRPDCLLLNHYGPTETTVGVLTRDGSNTPIAALPLGRALAQARVYLLDAAGNPALPGALGEIGIGGASVARGYVGQPGMTAARFVPDPFGPAGSRLYRSGDRARYLQPDDSDLEFLGRADDQVKIRGYRVEPEEIAEQLRALPGVDAAIVLARAAIAGDELRLFAYVAGAGLEAGALKAALAQRLPDHMIPGDLICLDRLPLTANGKIDRDALPLTSTAVAATRERRAATTPTEAILLAIWQAVLKREDIGVTDNFFEIGGDSILSLQVIARARRQGLKLKPKQVFEHPTVARLAEVCAPTEAAVLPIVTPISNADLPLTPIQAAFFARHPKGESHWNQAVLLGVRSELDVKALEAALQNLVVMHDALRLRFRSEKGQWRQRVVDAAHECALHAEPASLLEVVDLSSDDAWRARLHDEANRLQRSLDIEHGPLLKAGYFHLAGKESRLLLTVHHLAIDGVSWRILLDDLQHSLAHREPSREITAPSSATSSWATWSLQQQAYARSAPVLAERDWWLAALCDADGSLPIEATEADSSSMLSSSLDRETTRRLLHDCAPAYRTNVEDLLLTALAQTLGEWAQRDAVLVSLEGHGREALGQNDALDTSRTVGWFTTRHPVLLPNAGIATVKDHLRAVPHRGQHWGMLNTYTGDEETRRLLAALPKPRVSFNYLGRFDELAQDSDAGFFVARESIGDSTADVTPQYTLDLNGRIVDDELVLDWHYRPDQLGSETIAHLMQTYHAKLEALIDHCASAAPGATASDFPLSGLTQAQLEGLPFALGDIEDLYSATPIQRGLLFHSALQAEQGLYLSQRRFTLAGNVDRHALREAWEMVVSRHAILRTGFEARADGSFLQVVDKHVLLPWAEHDWTAERDYESRLSEWLQQDLMQDFDPAAAPLMRINLFAGPNAVMDLVWTSHHALADGWSSAQLMSEIVLAYEALLLGSRPALAVPVPYRDYIAWLAQQTSSEDWWRTKLATVNEPVGLSLLRQPQAVTEQSSRQEAFELDQALAADLAARLRQAAKAQGLTLNTLMQAAWALLLSRYGNRRQVVFGITVSGRPPDLEGSERMLGLFINSLPLWVDVPATGSVTAWLHALQAQNIELRLHEHTPLHQLQQWADGSGAGNGSKALFDSLLVFENYPLDPALLDRAQGLRVTRIAATARTHYPLTLTVTPGAKTIQLNWTVTDRSRLDEATLTRLSQHYANVLAQLAAPSSTDARLDKLVLRDDALTATLLMQTFPARLVVDRIREQAALRPSSVALSDDGETLSYAELESWSNQVAHRLIGLGVRADERVGLCLERSNGLVAGMLGILKSGGAYLPLDPAYPEERLAYMLVDAGVKRVIADAANAEKLKHLFVGCEVVSVSDVEAESVHALTVRVHPDQLAYVIYTSGSTGRPKGVAITHRNVSRLLEATAAWYAFNEHDIWPLFHSYAFDVSVWEIFGSLMHGGKLVIVPQWTTRDPEAFHRLLKHERITVLNQTPSAFIPLIQVDLAAAAPLEDLRVVIFAGEKLAPESLARWRAMRGDRCPALINMYGITETTVHVSYRSLAASDISEQNARSVIGEPIPDLSMNLLDLDMSAVPVGATGEIYVGGDGLARGYLNRPSLTAERFVPDPRGDGARLYKSGDLARRLDTGEPEYIGRNDAQVKLRGFRIELGEVRAALLSQPQITEAAVVVDQGVRLVAYVVPSHAANFDTTVLAAQLSTRLPSHMLPSAYVLLAQMPLTVNGKLDMRALPKVEAAEREVVTAGNDAEASLLAIWKTLLQRDNIGVTDHFFEVGGDSLLAVRLASRLSLELSRKVELITVFQHPTIRGLGAHLYPEAAIDERGRLLDLMNDLLETIE